MGNRCSTLEASGTKGRVAVEEGRAGTWDKDGGTAFLVGNVSDYRDLYMDVT